MITPSHLHIVYPVKQKQHRGKPTIKNEMNE